MTASEGLGPRKMEDFEMLMSKFEDAEKVALARNPTLRVIARKLLMN